MHRLPGNPKALKPNLDMPRLICSRRQLAGQSLFYACAGPAERKWRGGTRDTIGAPVGKLQKHYEETGLANAEFRGAKGGSRTTLCAQFITASVTEA